MSLLFRYTFGKMFFVTLVLSLILIGVVWLTQSLRFIEIIVNHNISLGEYLSLVVCLIPDLLVIILPICLLIAGLYVYHKLKMNHELHVFGALGLSPMQMARPLLILGSIVTVCLYVMNLYLTPLSFKKFRNQEHQIKNQFSLSWIREGAFNSIKGITLYIRERGKNGELKGVFIHNPQAKDNTFQTQKGHPYTIIADSGLIEKTGEELFVTLKNGIRQEVDPSTRRISEFSFEVLKYALPLTSGTNETRTAKPYEKSLTELLNPAAGIQPTLASRMRIEAHQRLLTPWVALTNSLISSAFMVTGSFKRREGRYKILLASLLAFVLQSGLLVLLNLSTHYSFTINLAYGLMVFMILGLMAFLKFFSGGGLSYSLISKPVFKG